MGKNWKYLKPMFFFFFISTSVVLPPKKHQISGIPVVKNILPAMDAKLLVPELGNFIFCGMQRKLSFPPHSPTFNTQYCYTPIEMSFITSFCIPRKLNETKFQNLAIHVNKYLSSRKIQVPF